ncbi:hypothetical protein JTB14_035581 [Gonioctena quinquepunctata]|nr:hypothetical protein JTB14_035581 [Gonioctena quinquepunctata]
MVIYDDESGNEEEEDNYFSGCGEDYYQTHLVEDCFQCTICRLWIHENCTEFASFGKNNKKQDVKNIAEGKGRAKKVLAFTPPTL